jgi:membrane protease YdiL (CAAX protease family)
MNLLSEIKSFLIKEKMYSILLLIVIVCYGLLLTKSPNEQRDEVVEHSQSILKNMENRIVQDSDALYDKNPKGMVALVFMMVLFFASCMAGLIVLIAYFWNASKGNDWIQQARRDTEQVWMVGDIVKCVILVLFFSLIINESFVFLRNRYFSQIDNELLILILTFILDLVAAGLVFYFIMFKSKKNLEDCGLKPWNVGSDLKLSVVSYIAFSPILLMVLVSLGQIADFFHYEPPPHELIHVFLDEKAGWGTFIFSFFLACIAGPIIEELFFRGFCYPAFKKRWGATAAMIISSVFFAAIHGSIFAFFPVFFLGLLLAYLYEKRKTLFPSIFLHILHNSIFILYFFIMKSVAGVDA